MGAYVSVVTCTTGGQMQKPTVLPADATRIMDILPPFVMSDVHKLSLTKHFHSTMLKQKPDIFHRTMLQCIVSSPKINEIIACQKYCFRDLSKWPKLDRLSQGQINFFDALIFLKHLEPEAVTESVYTLGVIHYNYARYGMKPHFLDLWQQQLTNNLTKLKFEDENEKTIYLQAFTLMNKYIVDVMNIAYAKSQQDAARCERKSDRPRKKGE